MLMCAVCCGECVCFISVYFSFSVFNQTHTHLAPPTRRYIIFGYTTDYRSSVKRKTTIGTGLQTGRRKREKMMKKKTLEKKI